MAVGDQPRYNAECPSCGSLERHRLFFLGLQRLNLLSGSERVLHFAAEASLMKTLKKSSASYQTAELLPGHADLALNIEQINLPDKSMDVVIANHVLEHVNDKAALRELRRVLSDSGRLFITIPLIEGWAKTYEDPAITSEAERTKHFGQRDHVRYFGRDFRDRVLAAGFTMTEFGCDGADAVKYSLPRGETLFICTKTKSE
ncbi:MAG: methyltransferase domain-containing protein [Terracidiphilus sp.]|jgi:SAM-dependent methyltransferase